MRRDKPMTNYFMWGLQRSGTNFLEQVIGRNLNGKRVNMAHRCWKHFIDRPDGYKANINSVILYKNPYTWAESLCFRNGVDWIKTQRKYPVQAGENGDPMKAGPRQFNVVQLAKAYKNWHDTWTQTEVPNSHIIRYESLLSPDTREEEYNALANFFRVPPPNQWNVPQRGTVSQSRDYNAEREQYYLSMEPNKLTKEQISAITKVITPELIEKIGYTPRFI